MIFSIKFALLALVSVVAAQSSSSDPGSSSSASGTTLSNSSSSSASSTLSATSSSAGNATTSGNAPLPSGAPPGLTPCILDCVSRAAEENGCTTFTNISCVCTSMAFQSAATSCLMRNCTQDEVTTATNLQMTECAAIVGSSGASGMPSNTGSNIASGSGIPITPAPTGASTSAPGAAAPTTTNGAHISAASGIWALVAGLMGITAAAL